MPGFGSHDGITLSRMEFFNGTRPPSHRRPTDQAFRRCRCNPARAFALKQPKTYAQTSVTTILQQGCFKGALSAGRRRVSDGVSSSTPLRDDGATTVDPRTPVLTSRLTWTQSGCPNVQSGAIPGPRWRKEPTAAGRKKALGPIGCHRKAILFKRSALRSQAGRKISDDACSLASNAGLGRCPIGETLTDAPADNITNSAATGVPVLATPCACLAISTRKRRAHATGGRKLR